MMWIAQLVLAVISVLGGFTGISVIFCYGTGNKELCFSVQNYDI